MLTRWGRQWDVDKSGGGKEELKRFITFRDLSLSVTSLNRFQHFPQCNFTTFSSEPPCHMFVTHTFCNKCVYAEITAHDITRVISWLHKARQNISPLFSKAELCALTIHLITTDRWFCRSKSVWPHSLKLKGTVCNFLYFTGRIWW